MVAWASDSAEARALARAMVALGVMRYRVMVGQQLQFAAEPVQLMNGCGPRRARECGTLPLCLLLFQFFFSLLSLRDELLPVLARRTVNREWTHAVISKLAPVRH